MPYNITPYSLWYELVFEVKDEHVEMVKKIINDAMVAASQKYITTIPAPVEIGVSQVWSK